MENQEPKTLLVEEDIVTIEDVNENEIVGKKTLRCLEDPTPAPEPKSMLSKQELFKLKKQRKKLLKKQERELKTETDVVARLKDAKAPTMKEMTLEEKKDHIHQLRLAKCAARRRVQPDERGPKQSEKEKMAREIRQNGFGSFLTKQGITEDKYPGVKDMIENAMKTGEINNINKMTEKLLQVLQSAAKQQEK